MIAFGSLFDIDFLKDDAREELNSMVSSTISTVAITAGVGTTAIIAGLVPPAGTILGFLAGIAVGTTISSILDDVRDEVRDGIFRYSTRQYFSLVLENLEVDDGDSPSPEAISVHYYPFDIENRYTRSEIMTHIANTSAWLSADYYQKSGRLAPVIITETGNMNWELDNESNSLGRMVDILDGFESSPTGLGTTRNFNSLVLWYKPLRADEKFESLDGFGLELLGIDIDNPPFTRFINDGNRDVRDVQDFIDDDGWASFCSDINSLGLEYYLRINGVECGSVP